MTKRQDWNQPLIRQTEQQLKANEFSRQTKNGQTDEKIEISCELKDWY